MNNLKHRFQVIEEKFGAYSSFKLTDIETGEYATILPYLGATVNGMALRHNNNLIQIMDGYLSQEDVEKNLTTSFKGSNLFPFPNRIAGGKYNHQGKEYQLDINFPQENNAIHGLVFDKNFEIISKEDGDINCSLVLLYSPEKQPAGYPFKYTLEVEFRWIKYALFECISKFTNHSLTEMPVGIGWHPYFIAGSQSVNDLWLQFPSESMLDVDSSLIPTGKSKIFENFNQLTQLSDSKFDSCFVLKQDPTPAEIVIFNKKENFGYKVWQETGENKYNFLQVYTPPTRNMIAFEPMTCAPNAFNNKQGLINLAPGKSVSVKWGVSTIN